MFYRFNYGCTRISRLRPLTHTIDRLSRKDKRNKNVARTFIVDETKEGWKEKEK